MKKKLLLCIGISLSNHIQVRTAQNTTISSFFMQEYTIFSNRVFPLKLRRSAFKNLEFMLPVLLSNLPPLFVRQKIYGLQRINNIINNYVINTICQEKDSPWFVSVPVTIDVFDLQPFLIRVKNKNLEFLEGIHQGKVTKKMAMQQELLRYTTMQTICDLLLKKTNTEKEFLVNYIEHDTTLNDITKNWMPNMPPNIPLEEYYASVRSFLTSNEQLQLVIE